MIETGAALLSPQQNWLTGPAEATTLRVGELLTRLRKHRNLSQEELARDLGISASYLSLLENGRRRTTTRVLRVLANYLHVPAAYVVLQDVRLDGLSERHRTIVRELRRELVEPVLRSVFGQNPSN